MAHFVNADGIESDPDKIQALSDWSEPHNIKTLRYFLGLTGYYRCFITDYARIVKPLNDILVGHPTNKQILCGWKEGEWYASLHNGEAKQTCFSGLENYFETFPSSNIDLCEQKSTRLVLPVWSVRVTQHRARDWHWNMQQLLRRRKNLKIINRHME